MKRAINCLCGVSLLVLALTACGKKEQEQPKTTNEEVVVPAVVERPPVVCDDVALKNRVVNLVQDQILKASLGALGNVANIAELEQQLKARLAETSVDVQDAQANQGECHAQLHIVLSDKDVEFANKSFAKAGLPTLAEQAAHNNISLLGTGRLVADFVYQVDGEALAIDKNNPALGLAANSLAKATLAMTKQNKANARKENTTTGATSKPNIVPAPTVNLRPVERPRPPTPEEAILRPEDVPSGAPRQQEVAQVAPSQNSVPAQEPRETRPEPKPKPKPEIKAEPKPEPKPAAPQAADNDAEITIVETDETY